MQVAGSDADARTDKTNSPVDSSHIAPQHLIKAKGVSLYYSFFIHPSISLSHPKHPRSQTPPAANATHLPSPQCAMLDAQALLKPHIYIMPYFSSLDEPPCWFRLHRLKAQAEACAARCACSAVDKSIRTSAFSDSSPKAILLRSLSFPSHALTRSASAAAKASSMSPDLT